MGKPEPVHKQDELSVFSFPPIKMITFYSQTSEWSLSTALNLQVLGEAGRVAAASPTSGVSQQPADTDGKRVVLRGQERPRARQRWFGAAQDLLGVRL